MRNWVMEFKMRVEERLMLAEFPGDYPGYRRRVPQLVQGLRLASERRLVSNWAGIQRRARGRDGLHARRPLSESRYT